MDDPTAKALKYVDATTATRADKMGVAGSDQLCSNCRFTQKPNQAGTMCLFQTASLQVQVGVLVGCQLRLHGSPGTLRSTHACIHAGAFESLFYSHHLPRLRPSSGLEYPPGPHHSAWTTKLDNAQRVHH